MPKPYPSPQQIEAIYAARDAAIARLGQQQSISVADVLVLDRLGRFKVAAELWGKCSAETRLALLNDEHPHVRSTAFLAKQTEKECDGFKNFSLPGVWDEVEPSLFVKRYNNGDAFIEAKPDGNIVRFEAKVSALLGGFIRVVEKVAESRANQADPADIQQAISSLEEALSEVMSGIEMTAEES